jgi:4'-phosphopantetheinyl transferase
MAFPANNLDEKSVHLWCLSIDDYSQQVSEYEHVLSEDEKDRAARFKFEEDRRRYLVSHGALRIILGSYLKQEPQSIRFRKNEAGKPEIIGAQSDLPVTFNMSHSGAAVLVGVARNRRIGVDVEVLSSRIDIVEIAEHNFTREEIAALRMKPEDERYGSFYSLWTCKEAYLKALGCGLSGGLQSFTMSENDNDWSLSCGTGDGSPQFDQWTIRSLKLMDGYAAAIAIDGIGLDIVIVRTIRNWGNL